MPFSHAPISSMASLSTNPLGFQQHQAQHKYEQHQQYHHSRTDDMTPPSSTPYHQCHMSRLNIPSPSLQSLHQSSHSGLPTLQNHHTYSSSSSSPHSAQLDVTAHPPTQPPSTPPSSLAPPSSLYSYDPINIGGYASRLSPCSSNDNYQLNGSSYVNSNGGSGKKNDQHKCTFK